VLAGIFIVAVILAIMVYSSLSLAATRVEVCVEFKGVTTCKIARGATQEAAVRTAIDNACGEMASGVTDSLACTRSQPVKITVLE
jgi:preprotein translocase subunit SecF